MKKASPFSLLKNHFDTNFIREQLFFEKYQIVLFDTIGSNEELFIEITPYQNIVCLNEKNEVLWINEDVLTEKYRPWLISRGFSLDSYPDKFVGIFRYTDNHIVAVAYSGIRYLVCLSSGKVTYLSDGR